MNLDDTIFHEIKGFFEALARECKGCPRFGYTCDTCPSRPAKSLLFKLCPTIPPRTENEIHADKAACRRALIIEVIKSKHPVPCFAKDFHLPDCTKFLRAWTLTAMVNAGLLVRHEGSYPSYTLKEEANEGQA